MNRRNFLKVSALGAGTVFGTQAPVFGNTPAPRKPALMKAGHQHDHSPETLRRLAAFGVNHICSALPSAKMDENWSVDGLRRLRQHVESFGIHLDCVPLPLSSLEISKAEYPEIMLGRDPERNRAIADICQMIRNAGRAGIPMVKYNLNILGVPRTAVTQGRGGAGYSSFDHSLSREEPPLTLAGRITDEIFWERITYFLERVVPVAQEAGVRIACHPHDPAMPPGTGFRGVNTVLGSVEGLRRFVETVPSPYHGLNFCQGTVSEMLTRPGEQIYDVIREFGERRKIFIVHFRNIEGGFLKFRETFPDNGDVDMPRALRVYRDIGYDGMIMPDHVPNIDGDTGRHHAFSYCFGYIQAALQMVNAEPLDRT